MLSAECSMNNFIEWGLPKKANLYEVYPVTDKLEKQDLNITQLTESMH